MGWFVVSRPRRDETAPRMGRPKVYSGLRVGHLPQGRHLRSVVFALPLGVGALEVFYAVFIEDPESCGYFVDEVVVVGD